MSMLRSRCSLSVKSGGGLFYAMQTLRAAISGTGLGTTAGPGLCMSAPLILYYVLCTMLSVCRRVESIVLSCLNRCCSRFQQGRSILAHRDELHEARSNVAGTAHPANTPNHCHSFQMHTTTDLPLQPLHSPSLNIRRRRDPR